MAIPEEKRDEINRILAEGEGGEMDAAVAELAMILATDENAHRRCFNHFAIQLGHERGSDGHYRFTQEEFNAIGARMGEASFKAATAAREMAVRYETPETVCDALIAADKQLNKVDGAYYGLQ
jgi:hypothetical protein